MMHVQCWIINLAKQATIQGSKPSGAQNALDSLFGNYFVVILLPVNVFTAMCTTKVKHSVN